MFAGRSVTHWDGALRPAGGRRRAARRLLAVLSLVLLGAFVILATPASAQEFSFNRYTQPSGLRNLGIEQLLFDRNGDMWLATDGGLYRYDGISFVSYDKSRGIPADATMAIAASPSGRIFTRVDAGLYSGNADHFEPLRSAAGALIADQYTMLVAAADDRVLYLKDHQLMQAQRSGAPGSLWSTRPVFSAARIAAQPELTQVQGVIAVDGAGLWFGCGLRLCRLDGTQLTVVRRRCRSAGSAVRQHPAGPQRRYLGTQSGSPGATQIAVQSVSKSSIRRMRDSPTACST